MLRTLMAVVLATLAGPLAYGASITASFTQLSGPSWNVNLAVINDGSPPEITGFTVYFDEALFSDLSVSASTAAWDSIVIQPDLGLNSAGFFDAQLLDPGAALTVGQSAAGFGAQFTYLGNGVPPMLSFDIVDYDFNVLESGVTVPASPIPEPSIALMLTLGLGILGRHAFNLGRPQSSTAN